MDKIEKIVELVIELDELEDENFDEFGVDVISLVEEPAIEVDFQYFNKESECDGQCEIRHTLSEESQEAILEYAQNNGYDIKEEDIFINFEGLSFEDVAGETGQQGGLLKSVISTIRNRIKDLGRTTIKEEAQTYYRYTGPPAQRRFCKAMTALSSSGRIFDESQINAMNRLNAQFAPKGQSSYSIFEFNGGVNCVHYWQKLSVYQTDTGQKIIMTADPSNAREENASKTQNQSKPSPYGAIENNARLNFSIDTEKKIVLGPVMVPNKFIKRIDDEGNPYYVYFTKKTIEKMAERFIKMNNQNKTDLNHDGNIMMSNTLLETWIKEDDTYDKSKKYGFDLPVGTWFVSYKLNDETWDLVKKEKVKGFSLAGAFIEKLASNKKENDLVNKIKNILKDVEN